jgi:uncharacterized membrane protein
MNTPVWALTLAFWVHMLATVIWIGGLVLLALVIIPVGRRTLSPDDYLNFISQIQRILDPVAWFALVVLVATGLIQMSANPNYEGFLAIDNRWSLAILIKHLIFVATIVVSAIMTWKVLPSLRRAAMRQAKGLPEDKNESYQRQELVLLWINLGLSVVILALTAIARTA